VTLRHRYSYTVICVDALGICLFQFKPITNTIFVRLAYNNQGFSVVLGLD